MYDWLLFIHVLAAFAVVATIVTYSALALGGTTGGRTVTVANLCWDIGGLGAFALGIWLAIYVKGYEVWDGWILGALVLFAIATELGRRARVGFESAREDAATMHWLRTVVVLAILVLMITKPGA